MSEVIERLVIGTRGSDLALVQAATAERALAVAFPDLFLERRVIRTTGDRRTDVSLAEVAKVEGTLDKGVFTKELEMALEAGEIDVAVHSLKDVPTVMAETFELAGALARAPIRDVLVTKEAGGLAALPAGAVVGTSSVRRAKQMAWMRPDLKVVDVRGNVPTRLAKLAEGGYDAILLAEAGLMRLGYRMNQAAVVGGISLWFAPLAESVFYPAAGQGAIGLQIRSGDGRVREMVREVNDETTFRRVTGEREFLRLLEGGCHTPVGVYSEVVRGELQMAARVFAEGEDGGEPRQSQASGADPLEVAKELYQSLS